MPFWLPNGTPFLYLEALTMLVNNPMNILYQNQILLCAKNIKNAFFFN